MRVRLVVTVAVAGLLGGSVLGQSNRHINGVIDLLAQGKPVFGLSAPSAPRGGGGGNRGGAAAGAATTAAAPTPATPPAPTRTPLDLAKDTLAHPEADYFFSGGMEGSVERGIASFTEYANALVEAGAIVKSPAHRLLAPLSVKTPKISTDPAKAIENVSQQLNAGVTSISFVHVDTAQELEQGIAAMRFKSRGGTRPEAIGDAPKYWGLTEKEYRAKADVWPLNPNGELLAWAIIETKEGVANVRAIAQVKGLGVLIPGAGTMRRVFPDEKEWEAANQQILAACKEFKVACGYPANDTDIEARMKQGFSVFIIQAFNERGFKAVEIGRQAGGRK